MINAFRRLLIKVGKVLPFIVCLLVCINYTENLFALATSDYLWYDGIVIPNTPISFLIGQYFEYNLQMLVVLCIISIAIETCIWNKIACGYLGVNLYEKYWFVDHIYDNEIYLSICLANVAIATIICLKGINVLRK